MTQPTINAKGLHLIVRVEAIVLVPYQDGKYNSIGAGHNGPLVLPHIKITVPQAFALLQKDCRVREPEMYRYCKREEVPDNFFNQDQWNALVTFYHQRSNRDGGFTKLVYTAHNSPELLEELWLSFDDDSLGNRMPGLRKRRAHEWSVYSKGAYEFTYTDEKGRTEHRTLNPVSLWRDHPRKTKPEAYTVTEEDLRLVA